jgi:hypothetical protein
MSLTRRRFVQMIGAAVAIIKAPLPAIADSLPRLVGDGLHNDAPALNALLNRLPIEVGPLVDVQGAGWVGTVLRLPHGNFAVREPIRIGGTHSDMELDGAGSRIIVGGKSACAIRVEDAERVSLRNLHISAAPEAQPNCLLRIVK